MKNLLFILLLCSAWASAQVDSFEITRPGKYSAGVYIAGSETGLVSTLFSGVQYLPGKYAFPTWDSRTELGSLAPSGNYEIRVLGSGMKFVWQGGIGNNSEQLSGLGKHAAYQFYRDAVTVDSLLYVSTGFTERRGVIAALRQDNPYRRIELYKNGIIHPPPDRICSDGVSLYTTGAQISAPDGQAEGTRETYVLGCPLDQAGNYENYYQFLGETSQNYGETYNVGDLVLGDEDMNVMSGIDVQQDGQLLAVTRDRLNSLHVIDKVTGDSMNWVTIADASLPKFYQDSVLFIVEGYADVYRYDIDESGTIANRTLVIQGDSILDLDVHGDTLVTADHTPLGDIIKAYDIADYSLAWTYGRAESYEVSANMYNDKLRFIKYTDRETSERTFVRRDYKGEYWIGDIGNTRMLHLDKDRNFIEAVYYMDNNYSFYIDPNDSTKMFSDQFEFKIDHSKNPTPDNKNGYWTMVRNWGPQLDNLPIGEQRGVRDPTTQANGRTYILPRDTVPFTSEFHELMADGTLRATGVIVPNLENGIYKRSNMWGDKIRYTNTSGNTVSHYQYTITGFDGSNNPILSARTTLNTYDYIDEVTPYPGSGNTNSGVRLNDEYSVVWQNNKISNNGDKSDPIEGDYHLGIVRDGADSLEWVSMRSVIYQESDPYPANATFDSRESVNISGAGNVSLTYGDYIFVRYHGEFWRAGQVNRTDVFHKSGLWLYQFGTDSASFGDEIRPPEHAGNSFSASIVGVGDKVILGHNDEGHHGQAHLWFGHNLNSLYKYVSSTITIP